MTKTTARGQRSIAVVIVHYHGPELVEQAWSALRSDAASHGIELEGVVVDNGSTADERRVLAEMEPRWIDAGSNLGYAGGANLGLRQTESEQVLLLNPDVSVLPGCLEALSRALDEGAAVTGPTFFWDRPDGFRLPPTERRSRMAEIGRVLGQRSGWSRRARQGWRSHARDHWTATASHASHDLSGALLAFRRSVWLEQPFDEGFPLYYEETDWLLRLRAAGEKVFHVPAARAMHGYARTTRDEPRAQEWFRISEQRFRTRHYGRSFTWILERFAEWWLAESAGKAEEPSGKPIVGPGPLPPVTTRQSRRSGADGGVIWLELSPTLVGFPAAGLRVRQAEDLRLSTRLWQILAPGTYFLRALDEHDRVVGWWTVVKDAGAQSPA